MTKILFMTLFYAPFYPNGFFFSAITLCVVYWMDKFCLFVSTIRNSFYLGRLARPHSECPPFVNPQLIWGRSPELGTEIAEYSRNYFFSLALAAYALMLSYGYAGWPFDNACGECGMN